jgi:hypothetical protein
MALGIDLFLPVEGHFFCRGGMALIVDHQAPMCARANACIFAIAPIEHIVLALLAGAGVVGNFVSGQARGSGQFLGQLIEIG